MCNQERLRTAWAFLQLLLLINVLGGWAVFQINMRNWKLFFLFLNQNICCGYSKEPSQWEGSFEYPKHMLKLMGKKIIKILRSQILCLKILLNWSYGWGEGRGYHIALFLGTLLSSSLLVLRVWILLSATDNCPSWIRGRERIISTNQAQTHDLTSNQKIILIRLTSSSR